MDSSPTTKAKTFMYNSPHQPVFNISEAQFHHKSLAQNHTIRNASFSSHLNPKRSDQFQFQVVQRVADDTELNVFDAQKYFSESNNDPKESKEKLSSHSNVNHVSELSDAGWRLSSASSVDGYNRNFRVRSFNTTPTASSEASWNSQIGLLSNPPGSFPLSLRNIPADHGRQKRGSSSAAKWIFCRKCPCSGKKSVQVDDGSSEHRTQDDKMDQNNNCKADFHKKQEGHWTRDTEKVVEKISMMPRKSSATDHDLAERHQNVCSNTSGLSSDNHFMSSSVLQQRVLASGRPFSDNPVAFSFPILNPLNPSYQIKPELNGLPTPSQLNSHSDEPPRESLEIFRPSDHSILRKSMDEQRFGLGVKTYGSALDRRGNFPFTGSPTTRVTSNEDDVSDASSDLFEIESFSTQTTSYPMYRRRDSLDEAATFNARRLAAASNSVGAFYSDPRSLDESMTPMTENYAPSEASIDWSVTTAEGFDRASITNISVTASEIEDFAIMRHRSLDKGITEQGWSSIGMDGGGGGDSGGEGGKKKGNGLLLSCRHERSVSVGPHPVKCMPEVGPTLPLASTSGHVSTAASRPSKPNRPPLAKGHSARLSLTFLA